MVSCEWCASEDIVSLIPQPYWGWAFLTFVIIAFILLLYGFYLIEVDPAFIMEPQIVLKKKGGKK